MCIYICILNILIILLNFLFHGAISVASSRHCWRPLILTRDKRSAIGGCHRVKPRQILQRFVKYSHSAGSVGPCLARQRDGTVSFSALKLNPLVSASPALLKRGSLFLLLAFIFLAEAGLRCHGLFGRMKVHKDELEMCPLRLCGAEG